MEERLQRMITAYEQDVERTAQRNCPMSQSMQDAWIAGAMMANVQDLLTLIYRAAENNAPASELVTLLEMRQAFSQPRAAA